MSRSRPPTGTELQQQPLRGCVPVKPASRQGLLPGLEIWRRAALGRVPSSPLCPVRIQLQLAPAAPTHLCEACWPPLRGRPRRAPSRGLYSNPWAPAAANPSASRRGQAGDPLVPGGPAPQGHGEYKPRAEGTGAHWRPWRCRAAPRARAAPGQARSRRPASEAQSTLQAVLKGDAAPRPLGRCPLLSAPSGRRHLGCCKRALARTAELREKRPARVCRTERSAEWGASLPPPRLPPPFLPPSLARSLAPSPLLRSPPPLTERLPYKIYESALSSRC